MEKLSMEVMKKEDIRVIAVHCTATYPDQFKDVVKWVEQNHRQRGFATTGYHFIITRDGRVHHCRPLPMMGAHEPLINRISVAIALEGGVDEQNKPTANYTPQQMRSLALKIWNLQLTYKIESVLGHRDLGVPKACPCFNVSKWWHNIGYPFALDFFGEMSREFGYEMSKSAKAINEPLSEEYL